MSEMVVNLHVTERCNYQCTYCFGKWGLESEVFQDTEKAFDVMRQLHSFFASEHGVRFNFVGGEPALLPNIADLVDESKRLGARTSYVTNGLMLRRFSPEWTERRIDVAGISIDSPHALTNLAVGRVGRNGRVFDPAEVVAAVRKIDGPSIKVNTVVSAWNAHEDFSDLISAISPDRWKILKMLPVYTADGSVGDEQFRGFLDRHSEFRSIIVSEDNDQMTHSYAMVDPSSRFFWYNAGGLGYTYSEPISGVGDAAAWASVSYDSDKFESRYP